MTPHPPPPGSASHPASPGTTPHPASPGAAPLSPPPGTERDSVGTVEDLHASATRVTGLSDFGTDDYRDGLAVLLESYARDADLTPLGRRVKRSFLRGALVARLLSEAAWASWPSSASVAIERPIFVTGLPRTGTTALHRLLAADPAHQGLEMWLTQAPRRVRRGRPGRTNPVFQRHPGRASTGTTPSTPSSWACTT